MKLSITMISFSDRISKEKMTVKQFIEICAGLGVDAVDLLAYFWQDREKEISEVPSLLKQNGLELGAYCVGNKFVLSCADELKKQYDYVMTGIDDAAKLGASRLRIFGGYLADVPGMGRQQRLDMVAEGIWKCLGHAKENGVTLVLENHGGLPGGSDEMKNVVEAVNSPYLKVLFDAANFIWYVDEDPVEAVRVLHPYIDHVHMKDIARSEGGEDKYEGCVVGKGIVPVGECMRALETSGYKGFVSLEYEAWARLESMQGVKESLDYLRNY